MSEVEESDIEGLDINDLLRENQELSENLSKCMEEKNFVWSLWKKLQTEKPDLSSVVSLVMAREKEKNEVRDSKVLNILETKDLQIQQLERDKTVFEDDIKQKDDDIKAYGLRLHDLLIEKAELQENLESIKAEFEERVKSLVKENDYLSELVRVRQIKLATDENAYRTKLDDMEKEKQEFHNVVKDLEVRLDKLNEEKIVNGAIFEENINLKKHLHILEEQMISLKQEHEDGMTTLRLRERQLQQHTSLSREHKELLNEKDQQTHALREELNELKLIHAQCGEHAKDQATLIQNLQSLQGQTQSVMKVQEEKFKSEIIELKQQLRDSSKHRETLLADMEMSKLQECERCSALEQELESVKGHHDKLLESTQEKNRRISSLEKTLVSKDNGQTGNSPFRTLERKCKSLQQKVFEFQKVLEMKQSELDVMSSAHSNRLQRYKNLQHEHKIVLEQLKTFENSSDDEQRKLAEVEPIPRATPRSLQNEDSDSVWNELKHFRTEYEKLRNERDSVMEEIDVLRVEHANDVSTIQELRMCLEDEKRELVEEIKINNAEENEMMRKENERLENERNKLKQQMETVKNDCSVAKKEKETLNENLRDQEQLVERLAGEISKYKKEVKVMKNERKKRAEKEDKTATTSETQRNPKLTDKQIQTETTFEKQLHEATKQLILDASRDNQLNNISQRDAQTSPIKTFAESSGSLECTAHGDRTTIADECLRNESVNLKDGKIPGGEDASNRSEFETPAKRARVKMKSPVHREWKSTRQRVLSLTQQVAALKSAKESISKSLTEQKSSNEKLQNDLNQSQQRGKVSKQTVDRLNKELEESHRQNQALTKNFKEYKVPSYPTEKHLEDRLKLSANECSRLSHELKSARKTNEELHAKLKLVQEKNTRHEHTLNQKKVFVEEMRSRLKVALTNLESTQDSLQEAEEKIRQMTEKENQRKNQLDSLKHRLETELNEKNKIDKLYTQSLEEGKKKAKLLSQAQSLRHEAEMAVNEMEEAANTQLHNLANQSQVTLSAIEQRLIRSKQRLGEFQVVIRTITQRLADQISDKRLGMKQKRIEKLEEEKKTASMVQACELASSILNMSKADIDQLLDVEDEDIQVSDQEHNWKEHVEEILSREESIAAPLIRLLLDLVENLVLLEKGIDDVENDIR